MPNHLKISVLSLFPPPLPLRRCWHSKRTLMFLVSLRFRSWRRVGSSRPLGLMPTSRWALLTWCLKIGELLVMPSCREKGKGEQIHGRTQPLKHTIFVGVEYFPLGDLHVARVGQHQGGQEEATHLLSLESANDVGERFENSLSCFCLSLGQLPQNLGTIFMNVEVFPLLHRLQFRANHIVPSRYSLSKCRTE